MSSLTRVQIYDQETGSWIPFEGGTNTLKSSNNSSTTPLSGDATFTGTAELNDLPHVGAMVLNSTDVFWFEALTNTNDTVVTARFAVNEYQLT